MFGWSYYGQLLQELNEDDNDRCLYICDVASKIMVNNLIYNLMVSFQNNVIGFPMELYIDTFVVSGPTKYVKWDSNSTLSKIKRYWTGIFDDYIVRSSFLLGNLNDDI